MKSKLNLILSIFQLTIGTLAILSFVIITLNGENMKKWLLSLILSLGFVVTGILGIVSYNKTK